MLTVRQAKREFRKKTQRTVREAVRDDNGVIIQRRKRERVPFAFSFREFCREEYATPLRTAFEFSPKLLSIVTKEQ